jgi:hypothetical protein
MDPSRPIPDAADQVRNAAQLAATMLSELRTGWLWQLLTRPPTRKRQVSNEQPTPSDAT